MPETLRFGEASQNFLPDDFLKWVLAAGGELKAVWRPSNRLRVKWYRLPHHRLVTASP